MIEFFGERRTTAGWMALLPGLASFAEIRHLREENGPNSGQRVMRIETGGGLSVELLPDRSCDIGQVWLDGRPLAWKGPIGLSEPARLRGNQALSGLMTTCGYDHIRQPETDDGRAYPLHGTMMHQGALVRTADMVILENETAILRIEADATQFSLDRGGMRLRRRIDMPVGGTEIRLCDHVTVLSMAQPVMAMYHFNFAYPLAGPDARLELEGSDITAESLGVEGVTTHPVRLDSERARAELCTSNGKLRVTLDFNASALPIFQTLRNSTDGINLTCLEPASHPRMPREKLRAAGMLEPCQPGETREFQLIMKFGN